MKPDAFKSTLSAERAPEGIAPALQALWHVAKGDWESAHRIAQDDDSADGAWVHAYLHRVEGDLSNAGYWYNRAGRTACEASLQAECDHIVDALLRA